MTALSIVLGILLIIGGFSCMFTPLATFLQTGYFIGVMMLVYGVSGLIRGIKYKGHALGILISVLAVIVGLFSLFRPGTTLAIDGMLIYMIAIWFVMQGISSIVMVLQVKGIKKGWYWGLIVGILGIILGIYSFGHPVLTAFTAGILIGFYFVESGINMIAMAIAVDSIR